MEHRELKIGIIGQGARATDVTLYIKVKEIILKGYGININGEEQ